jgi:phosphoglucosamine mutase
VLRFGTDGVRGDADTELTSQLTIALGRAVARVLPAPHVLIGRDTRESGPRIERELAIGIAAEGGRAVSLGVLPTPAIAFAAARERVPALIVSASHNPWTDNGVKVVGADGRKLADTAEAAIEHELRAAAELGVPEHPSAPLDAGSETDAYVEHLLGALTGGLAGLAVVLDCANGATSVLGPHVFRAAGADVSVLHDAPDGRNINLDCGSTHPESLQAAVRARGTALGLALDGDGDRVLAVDERGELVDGDQIMTMIALDLAARDALRNNAIAVTVMSNLGLRRALRAAGIGVVETPVGDRHVVAAMEANDLVLGGEQSGHIVFAEHATTGDGLLTGLMVCDLVRRSRTPLSRLAAQMTRLPQVLVNVRVAGRVDLATADSVTKAIAALEAELGERGRVLVRASGTEPLVRVMVEAESQTVAAEAADRLRTVISGAFAAP